MSAISLSRGSTTGDGNLEASEPSRLPKNTELNDEYREEMYNKNFRSAISC